MNGNIFPIAFLAVSVLLVATIASTVPASNLATGAGVLNYHSNVCIEVDRVDGSHQVVECEENPNFFTIDGKNAVLDKVGVGSSSAAFSQICIGNASTTNGSLIAAIPSASVGGCYTDAGLANATGTFSRPFGNSVPGNWSVSATFTATADGKAVNGTGLLNGSSTGSVFFANNTFTTVTLNTNDQITIRWNISIS